MAWTALSTIRTSMARCAEMLMIADTVPATYVLHRQQRGGLLLAKGPDKEQCLLQSPTQHYTCAQNIVVIGGGAFACEAMRSAVWNGAASVTMLTREKSK